MTYPSNHRRTPMTEQAKSTEQVVYTKSEVEAAELAVEINEYLIDNYSDYSAHVMLAALLINVDGLTKAIQGRNKHDETRS